MPITAEPHTKQRAYALKRRRQITLAGQDIGDIPPCANIKRRQACDASFVKFCEVHHSEKVYRRWSGAHRRAIDKVEAAVCNGGVYAFAMPRGWGKTTICELGAEWGLLPGLHPFVVVIRATAEYATDSLTSLKTHFSSNLTLLEDYPEVLYPIWCLEGESRRCLGQRYKGKPTYVGWRQNEIILPSIPGAAASEAVVRTAGITGNIRGAKYDRHDGRTVRPTLVIVDDPQTDESAKSPTQVDQRLAIIRKTILRLGEGRPIAVLVPCTVIEPNDVADQLLTPELYPEFQGQRTRMVEKFPEKGVDPHFDQWEQHWQEYRRIQIESLQIGRSLDAEIEYYRANRDDMDKGVEMIWPEKYEEPNEISGVQHAMNRFLKDEHAFWCEDQNEPQRVVDGRVQKIASPTEIRERVNRLPRQEVPANAIRLTAGIDVHNEVHYWIVVAWDEQYTGYIVDYGTWPDQRRQNWRHESPPVPLSSQYKGAAEARVRESLFDLTNALLGLSYPRSDNATSEINLCTVDSAHLPDQVRDVCKLSGYSSRLLPLWGVGIGPTHNPMQDYTRKKGDELGWHWYLPPPNTSGIRTFRVDTNHWKSFLQARWAVAPGDPGALTLFGSKWQEHESIAEHFCGELPTDVTAKGRTVTTWESRGTYPNHWLDCLVGATAAAQREGIRLPGGAPIRPVKKKISLSELQKQRRLER